MIICLTTGGEEGRDGVLRNETLLQERTREGGGGAYACLFRERDGGYRQSRKVEAAEDGENYVCM